MTSIIKRCRGKKKKGVRGIDKVMIPDSGTTACPEFDVK